MKWPLSLLRKKDLTWKGIANNRNAKYDFELFKSIEKCYKIVISEFKIVTKKVQLIS